MMSTYNLNDHVEIHNLLKNVDLNGKRGKICKEIDNGRYGVLFDNQTVGKLIKVENITLIKNNIKMDILNKNTNLELNKSEHWCLHPDCLTSIDYFTEETELQNHMKTHEN